VAPRPIIVRLTPDERAAVKRHTRERMGHRGYASRPDAWGAGLIGTYRAIETGFAGEFGFASWASTTTGLPVVADVSLRHGGDGGIDFRLCATGVQVKTATSSYSELLVRSRDVGCSDWEVIVRAQWPARKEPQPGASLFAVEDRADRSLVALCGWAWERDFMRLAKLEPGRAGDHTNYALPAELFLPMGDLAAILQARRDYMKVVA